MILKHLTITYNDQTLYDGEIAELIWSDTDKGVKVEGRTANQGYVSLLEIRND